MVSIASVRSNGYAKVACNRDVVRAGCVAALCNGLLFGAFALRGHQPYLLVPFIATTGILLTFAYKTLSRPGNLAMDSGRVATVAPRYDSSSLGIRIAIALVTVDLVQGLCLTSLTIQNRSIVSVMVACLVASCFFAFARRFDRYDRDASLQPIASASSGEVAPINATSFDEMHDTVPSPARRRAASNTRLATEPAELPPVPTSGAGDTFWITMLAGLRALSQANLWMAGRKLNIIHDEYLLTFRGYVSNNLSGWDEDTRASFEHSITIDMDSDQVDRERLFSAALAYLIARYEEAADTFRHFTSVNFGTPPTLSAQEFAVRDAIADLQRRSIIMPDAVVWQTVSLVLPAYNEEQVIAETASACLAAIGQACPNAEIIIVDDGSRDSTGAIIDRLAEHNACIRAVHNRPNRGYGGALRSGFSASRGDYTFFMDSDGQFEPGEIRKLLTIAQSRPSSAVIGYRAKRNDPLMRRLNAWGWKLVTRATLGLNGIRDIDCAFKLLPTAAVRRCALSGEGASINAEMLMKLRYMRVPIIQVPVTHKPREKGSPTGANLRVIVRAFKELRNLRVELRRWKPATADHYTGYQGELGAEASLGLSDRPSENMVELEQPPTSWVRRTMARILVGPAESNDLNPMPVRALVLLGVGLWTATRFALLLFTFMTSMFEAGHSAPPTVYFPDVSLQPIQMLKEWQQYDALWYTLIATKGYWPNATAFFPLFPLLIHIGIAVTGAKYAWFVGMVINNFATLIGCIGTVFFVFQETRDRDDARRGLLLLLCYPLAFFLAAPYTEGLLLATASWAFWAMRRGNWWVAASCVFLASVSRPTGFALYPPLLFEFARQNHWGQDLIRWHDARLWLRKRVLPGLAVVMSVPLGFGLFALYCWQQFGDPLLWIHVDQTYFGRVRMPVWESLRDGFAYYLSRPAWSFIQFHNMTDFIPLVAMMALTLVLSVRQPVAFTLFMGALLYLTVAGPQPVPGPGQHWVWYMSAGRYLLPSLPIWLALARWSGRHPSLESLLVYGGVLLQAVCTTQFLLGRWMV